MRRITLSGRKLQRAFFSGLATSRRLSLNLPPASICTIWRLRRRPRCRRRRDSRRRHRLNGGDRRHRRYRRGPYRRRRRRPPPVEPFYGCSVGGGGCKFYGGNYCRSVISLVSFIDRIKNFHVAIGIAKWRFSMGRAERAAAVKQPPALVGWMGERGSIVRMVW